MTRFAAACGAVVFLAASGAATAQDRPVQTPSGDHTDARAGFASELSRRAQPGNTDRYMGGMVGGGRLRGGVGPTVEQGVFGWDYVFLRRPGLIFQGWANGRRVHPASYGYKTDTHKVPNPLESRIIQNPPAHGEGGHGEAGHASTGKAAGGEQKH